MSTYNFKDLIPVKYWVQNILPQSYTDSLSYEELLYKVIAMLNKVIENNNMIPQYVQDMILAYISSGEIGNVVRDILANYMLNVKNPPNNLTPAVGDGSADDTEAIQGCIDYANANGGKCVYFPSGSYLVQSLDWKNNVSVCGFDRSTTRLVLKGGAIKPLISGTVNNVTISKLKLDGNMDIQVNNIDLIDLTGGDIILTDLDFTDGYNLVKINATGNVSGSLLVFDTAVVDAFIINGNGIVNFDNIMFKKLSALNGRYIINNSVDNAVFTQIYSLAGTEIAINNTGNKCVFEGQVLNVVTKIIEDTGVSTYTNFYNNGGTLQKSINDEITNRTDADSLLQENIDDEALAREQADNLLQDNIDGEKLAREQADQNLDDRIADHEGLKGSTSVLGHFIADSETLEVENGVLKVKSIAVNYGNLIDVTKEPYNAVGDGVMNCTTAIQNAINDCQVGGKVIFPVGEYKITSPLAINKPLTLEGVEPFTCRLLTVGCNGIQVNKISSFVMKNLGISSAVRYTTTPNALTGINVDGDTTLRPSNHLYQNVYIDGFYVAFSGNWMWSSTFDAFECGFCHMGMQIDGLSVNNVINNNSIECDGSAGSRGIYFVGNSASEGWMISNTLINNVEIGIKSVANTHILINNCILDHIKVYGILIQSSAVNFGGNWIIRGTYVAMSGTGGDSGICCQNNINNSQIRGNIIEGNHVIVYDGAQCNNGIYIVGTYDINNVVNGNTIKGFSVKDINSIHGNNTIVNNKCLSVISSNIYGGDLVANNSGRVYYERSKNYSKVGDLSITYDEAAPIAGTWLRGDICFNITPSASGKAGWTCVESGSPGTWKAFGVIDA